MRDVLDQVDAAIDAGLYYVALMGALTIPDLCAALETPDEPVGKRWSRWYEANIQGGYLDGPGGVPWLSGRDAYQFRCAFLHEGSAQPAKETRHGRIIFVEPGGPITVHLNSFRMGEVKALAIDVQMFVHDVTSAARRWLDAIEGTEPFETNLRSRVVTRHADGLPPFIGGAPVIA
jgi:hypothetical protein